MKFNSINADWWRNRFNHHYLTTNDFKMDDSMTINDWLNIIKVNKPEHTDRTGFFDLLERVKQTNSKLVFLTARKSNLKELTLKQLGELYIDTESYPVYFSGDIPKGVYIRDNFDIKPYNSLVFIDDLDNNLINVSDVIGSIKCYKFIQ
jgi:acid phosphatase class B